MSEDIRLKFEFMDGSPKPDWLIKEECGLVDKCPANPLCEFGCEHYQGCYECKKESDGQ